MIFCNKNSNDLNIILLILLRDIEVKSIWKSYNWCSNYFASFNHCPSAKLMVKKGKKIRNSYELLFLGKTI